MKSRCRKCTITPVLPIFALAVCAGTASAVPVLQVGAAAGPGDTGVYADYAANSTSPSEEETAFTSGNTIYVAGVYRSDKVQNLGSQYGAGDDWSGVSSAFTAFDGKGAVLLAAVPDGSHESALAGLTVNGSTAFYSSTNLSGLFPNNHDPLKDSISDFLFFDIGDFQRLTGAVPDLIPETGAADGEVKALTIGGTDGLDWIHFDVLALETRIQGKSNVSTTIANNPGSHDLTWKKPGPNPGPDPGPDPAPIPAPLALLGLGGLMLGWTKKRTNHTGSHLS